jgi:hypothetical protein
MRHRKSEFLATHLAIREAAVILFPSRFIAYPGFAKGVSICNGPDVRRGLFRGDDHGRPRLFERTMCWTTPLKVNRSLPGRPAPLW